MPGNPIEGCFLDTVYLFLYTKKELVNNIGMELGVSMYDIKIGANKISSSHLMGENAEKVSMPLSRFFKLGKKWV